MCDRGTPALCASGALVLEVEDDNDCRPTLHTPALPLELYENEPPNTKVLYSTSTANSLSHTLSLFFSPLVFSFSLLLFSVFLCTYALPVSQSPPRTAPLECPSDLPLLVVPCAMRPAR